MNSNLRVNKTSVKGLGDFGGFFNYEGRRGGLKPNSCILRIEPNAAILTITDL